MGGWLRAHDPGYGALRRATRAAILMPALFALGDRVIGNATMSYFIAFGAFAMLLLVGFAGSVWDRVRAQALLGLACAVLLSLGTLVSGSTVLSVIGMAVVGVAVIFSGVVSSVIAGATTALLLAFILPITVPGPASQIPERAAGWGLSAFVSLFAIALLWPAPAADPVRARAVAACQGLAARLRAEVAWIRARRAPDPSAGVSEEDHRVAVEQADRVAVEQADRVAVEQADQRLADLQQLFFATPYRPTGLSTEARAEIRLVDELRWLNTVVFRSAALGRGHRPNESVCGVKLAAADVLDEAAALLAQPRRTATELTAARARMATVLEQLEQTTTRRPELTLERGSAAELAKAAVSALDPSFRAQELSYVTRQIAGNIEVAAAAANRPWLDRLLGRQPPGFTGTLTSARERALAHAERSSSWLHNSIRGGVALGLAVLVADVTTVQHGFWVVFGTLAVLRSSALATGQNVMRALIGTTAGFVVGGALVALIGTNTTVLWLLLPFCVLFAGLAPAAISFAAGQAAFTITLLVLYNLLVPVGWRLGIVRVEDVAIGGAVSLAVGLLFWPRGAGPALGRALASAYRASTEYLSQAVAYSVRCCDGHGGGGAEPPRAQALLAAAAARRLDDTFRGYLADRGAKRIPLGEVTTLVNGVAGVRLAADAVLDLWEGTPPGDGDRSRARKLLLSDAERITHWYDRFADSLVTRSEVPAPLGPDQAGAGELAGAVAHDLLDGDGHATATGVRVIWTGDHIDAVRRLQASLVGPAQAAVVEREPGSSATAIGQPAPEPA